MVYSDCSNKWHCCYYPLLFLVLVGKNRACWVLSLGQPCLCAWICVIFDCDEGMFNVVGDGCYAVARGDGRELAGKGALLEMSGPGFSPPGSEPLEFVAGLATSNEMRRHVKWRGIKGSMMDGCVHTGGFRGAEWVLFTYYTCPCVRNLEASLARSREARHLL